MTHITKDDKVISMVRSKVNMHCRDGMYTYQPIRPVRCQELWESH